MRGFPCLFWNSMRQVGGIFEKVSCASGWLNLRPLLSSYYSISLFLFIVEGLRKGLLYELFNFVLFKIRQSCWNCQVQQWHPYWEMKRFSYLTLSQVLTTSSLDHFFFLLSLCSGVFLAYRFCPDCSSFLPKILFLDFATYPWWHDLYL